MITIAWDIDDVCNDLMREWFEKKWLIDHPDCSIVYGELIENPPHEILGVGQDEYLQSLDEFRLSGQFLSIQPVKEVLQWFNQHGHHFRHIAITAVPMKAAHINAFWLLREFGRWIRTYHFIPSTRQDEVVPLYDANKRESLKWFDHVDIFVDDNENNLFGVDEMGVKSFLFPRPWNRNNESISAMLEALTNYVYQLRELKVND